MDLIGSLSETLIREVPSGASASAEHTGEVASLVWGLWGTGIA